MILRLQNKGEHTRFYILLSFLMFLAFSRYGLQNDIPRIVLTGCIVLIALLGKPNEILAIAMCCIPLHEAVDFFYAVVACAGIYVTKSYKSFRINLAIILLFALILWELLHCFDASFSIIELLVSMIPLIFLTIILCIDISNVDYAFIVRVMSLVVAVTCAITLMREIVIADFNLVLAISSLQRLGLASEDVMLGSTINPNSLGIVCVLATTGLMQLRMVEQKKKADMLLMIVLLVFGALTVSRTFLICLILMAVLLLLAQPGDLYRKIRLLSVMALITLTVLWLLNWIFPDLLPNFVKRFRVSDISTGRNSLMTAYHLFITDNLDVMFFGVGLQSYAKKLVYIYRVASNTPHNAIQEIVVAWGIPGLILLIMFCLLMLRRSSEYNKKHTLLNYIPMLIILAKSMAGQLLTSHYSMLALSYAYLSLCQDFRPKVEQ